MLKSFKSKGLAELWETGKTARIDAKMHKRITIRLDRMNSATALGDLNATGFNFHPLNGFNPTRYSIHVNGPWCITFEFDGKDLQAIDYEQYH